MNDVIHVRTDVFDEQVVSACIARVEDVECEFELVLRRRVRRVDSHQERLVLLRL